MRYIINIIAILIVGLLVFATIKFKQSSNSYPFEERLKKIGKVISKFMNVQKRNFDASTRPPRKAPLTSIDREEAMRQYVPYLFGNFTNKDWKDFWAIIYQPIDVKEGGLTVKHFRTRDEVQRVLADKYPDPFGYFQENHWYDFWKYIARIDWTDRAK
jgi:flavodoxin